MRWYSRRPVLDTTTPPGTGRVGQADALRGVGAVPQGVAPPFGPAADAPQPPAGHLGNLFRNMVRGPPQAPPPAPYPPVQPQQFAAGGPPPPHYQWGPGFAHQPMGPHYMPPQPPPQLQPAPVFQGFYGPGGVWQPWGDRRLVEVAAPQQRPAQQQQQQQDAPSNNARATAAPAPATTEEGEQSTPQRVPLEGERPISQDQAPSAPREAATLAALRRLSPGIPSAQNQEPSTSPSQPHQATSALPTAPSVPPTATTQATVPPPTSSGPPRLTSTILQPTSATPTPTRNVNVPSLIPMSFSPGSTGPRPANAPLPSPPVVYRTAPRHALPARPLATLPPTLTDAQLAHLDVLTREAIDERLRVLEGISSTMYRCVEELTRLRSVLPASTGPAPPSTLARSQPGQGQQGSTTQTAVHESNNAPDLRSLDSDVKIEVSSDVLSSNAKSDADVSGASSSSVGRSDEANGDAAIPAD